MSPKVSRKLYSGSSVASRRTSVRSSSDAEQAEHRRGTSSSANQKRQPELGQQHVGAERAEHVERAVGEVDHPQHAEDDGQAEREQRVEAAPDQPVERAGAADRHRTYQLAVRPTGRGTPAAAGIVLRIFS